MVKNIIRSPVQTPEGAQAYCNSIFFYNFASSGSHGACAVAAATRPYYQKPTFSNMRLRFLSAITLAAILAACSPGKYQKNDTGIIVNIDQKNDNDVRRVRLQVFGDKIIRVTATPDKDFSQDTSLVVLPHRGKADFKVEETDSTVSVVTAAVRAQVSLATGDVKFFNTEGRLIVKEAEGGREFSPIEVEGTKGYTVRQTFESLDDEEGIYGLGQHHSDEFNYKGKNEELFQYNTKVSVPFVVSTDNYGIL